MHRGVCEHPSTAASESCCTLRVDIASQSQVGKGKCLTPESLHGIMITAYDHSEVLGPAMAAMVVLTDRRAHSVTAVAACSAGQTYGQVNSVC